VWQEWRRGSKLKVVSSRADAVRPSRVGAIDRVIFTLAGLLIAALSFSQAGTGYVAVENPFQNDYDFALVRPITMRVDVQGVRFGTLTVVALGEVRTGEKVKCEVSVVGSNETEKKATVTAVLLFENTEGKGIERLTLETFKTKSARAFDERQKVSIGGDTLRAASKVYVFIQIAF
jgi:hypothetical protein